MGIIMNPRGKDIHRLYFIAYYDGGLSMVANSRDESTLESWAAIALGIDGVSHRGVYRREGSSWVFDRPIAEPSVRPYTIRGEKVRPPPLDNEARSEILSIIEAAGTPGILSGEIAQCFLSKGPKRSKRTMYRYLQSFVTLKLISVENEPGNRKRYRVVHR